LLKHAKKTGCLRKLLSMPSKAGEPLHMAMGMGPSSKIVKLLREYERKYDRGGRDPDGPPSKRVRRADGGGLPPAMPEAADDSSEGGTDSAPDDDASAPDGAFPREDGSTCDNALALADVSATLTSRLPSRVDAAKKARAAVEQAGENMESAADEVARAEREVKRYNDLQQRRADEVLDCKNNVDDKRQKVIEARAALERAENDLQQAEKEAVDAQDSAEKNTANLRVAEEKRVQAEGDLATKQDVLEKARESEKEALAQLQPRRLALVIGISYKGHAYLKELRSCIEDATRMTQSLEVSGYLVRQLLDPSCADMLSALVDLNMAIQEKDEVFVYASGHGVELPTGDTPVPGTTFLLPNDFPGEKRTTDYYCELARPPPPRSPPQG
jgi:hypothetical protein